MKINCYCYDSLKNPSLGGGGIYREVNLHKELAGRHEITFYSGRFKKAKDYSEGGMSFKFLGLSWNYLVSRISFAVAATLHSLFSKADLYVVSFSAFSPVLTYVFKPHRTVVQFYHFVGDNAWKKYGIFGIFPFMAENGVLRIARYFITMAGGIARTIREKYGKKAIPTYTGIDTKLMERDTPEAGYLLSFGRIDVHMKGLDVLFDIFDSLAQTDKHVKLVVAGRGTDKDMKFVRDRIARSESRPRIRFVENPSYKQKLDLFRKALMLVIPSRFEGWNIVAVEAAACSKPVVASDIPGLCEAVKDGRTGILCPSENVKAFVQSIGSLLKDRKKRKLMGRNAYQYARQFNWPRIAALQEKFYIDVFKAKI